MTRRRAGAVLALVGAVFAAPGVAQAADPVRDAQWHLEFLDIAQAHRHSRGEGVVVGVIDTGIDADHPDLAGNVLPGVDFSTQATPDGLSDLDGHGTAMAGLIAANGRALGIAPAAKVQSIRVGIGIIGGGTHLLDGIEWATREGVDVICITMGSESGGQDYDQVLAAALDADIVVVAAAGNRPIVSRVVYPAAHAGVIAAAGVDRDGEHASVSVTGPKVVLAAPAADIVSTGIHTEGNGYRTGTGTSDAAAIIAGAAALVRSRFPDLSAAEVVHRLTATADDRGPPGRDSLYGYGVLNIVRALTDDVPTLATATQPAAAPVPTRAAPPPHDQGPPILAITAAVLLLVAAAGLTIGLLSSRRSG